MIHRLQYYELSQTSPPASCGETDTSLCLGVQTMQVWRYKAISCMTAAVLMQVDNVYAAHKSTLDEARYADGAKEAIQSNMMWLEQNAGPTCTWLSSRTGR